MSSIPRFTHNIRRVGHMVMIESIGIGVTFFPQDKDRTLMILLLKLKEYGDDITGDDFQSTTARQAIDRQLASIYVEWEKGITSRTVTLPERLAAQVNATLVDKWMDYEGRHFVAMEKDVHLFTFNMDHEDFGKEVSNIAFRDLKELVSNDKRDLAIRHLKDQTTKRKAMFNRVAMIDTVIYYDLHHESGQAIKISSEEWHVIPNPLFFRRPVNNPAMYAAPIPNRDYPRGRHFVRELIDMMSIKYEHQRLILEVLVFTYFIPNIAHPVLLPFGPAGSGKSTLMRLIRMLIDPLMDSDGLLESMPVDPRDRRVDVVDNYITFWDNVSHLKPEDMNDICRISTGTKVVVRVLHTTDERREYVIKRIVGLSGINIPFSQSDAMTRGFILEMNNIDRGVRNEEEGSNTSFSEYTDSQRMAHIRSMLPDVYGYMMDIIVKTLQIYKAESETIKPNHRLDDFVVWAECFSRALGKPPGDFLKAWETNVQTQKFALIENNSFASLFVRYVFNAHVRDETFSLGPLEMFNDFVTYSSSIVMDYYSDKNLPKNESWFGRKLAEIQPDLTIVGINVELNRNAMERKIVVSKNVKVHQQYLESAVKREQNEKNVRERKILSQEEEDVIKAMQMFKNYCNENATIRVIPSTFQTYLISRTSLDAGKANYIIQKLLQDRKLAYDDDNNLILGVRAERDLERT